MSWYRITDVFMISPPPAQGQTTPTEQLEECQLDGSEGEAEARVTLVLFTERRPLLDLLHNIHPNVRYTFKYRGSDSYIV